MSDREPLELPAVPRRTPPPSRGRRAAVAVGALVAVVLAALLGAALGRGGDDREATAGPSAAPSPSASPSATPSASPSASPSPSPSASPVPVPSSTDARGRVVDGTDVGYLTAVQELDDGSYAVEVDRVVLLTGQAARDEATRRGQELDTDHLVVNDNDLTRDYVVSDDATVTLDVPLSGRDTTGPVRTGLQGLLEARDRQDDPLPFLFDLVVRGGVVVELDHRYLA